MLTAETKQSLQEKIRGHRWVAGVNSDGYPKMKVEGKSRLASHVLLESLGRDVPEGKVVMHKDNDPKNLDPSNLRVGTQQQNLKQMRDEGRDRPRGVKQEPDVKKFAFHRPPNTFWNKIAERIQARGGGNTVYLPKSQWHDMEGGQHELIGPNYHVPAETGDIRAQVGGGASRLQMPEGGLAAQPPVVQRRLNAHAQRLGMDPEAAHALLSASKPAGVDYGNFLLSVPGAPAAPHRPTPAPALAPPSAAPAAPSLAPTGTPSWLEKVRAQNAAATVPASTTLDVPAPRPAAPTLQGVPRPRPGFQPINPSPAVAGLSSGRALPTTGMPKPNPMGVRTMMGVKAIGSALR